MTGELAWVAVALVIPVTAIAWKHGVTGQSRSLIQGLMVVFGAVVTSGAYLALKDSASREPDTVEKLWLAFPLLASLTVTGRCIFGRIARFFFRTRRRPQPKEID